MQRLEQVRCPVTATILYKAHHLGTDNFCFWTPIFTRTLCKPNVESILWEMNCVFLEEEESICKHLERICQLVVSIDRNVCKWFAKK